MRFIWVCIDTSPLRKLAPREIYALQAVETSLQFYRKYQSEIREMFESPPDKSLDIGFVFL